MTARVRPSWRGPRESRYGCNSSQEVCPWNIRFSQELTEPDRYQVTRAAHRAIASAKRAEARQTANKVDPLLEPLDYLPPAEYEEQFYRAQAIPPVVGAIN